MSEIDKLAKKIEKKIKRTEEEEKITSKELLTCAVIISEIMKEKLDYPSLFKKVKENKRIQYEFSDKEFEDKIFSKMLGELMLFKLVDGERNKENLLSIPFLVLTEKGKKLFQEETEKYREEKKKSLEIQTSRKTLTY